MTSFPLIGDLLDRLRAIPEADHDWLATTRRLTIALVALAVVLSMFIAVPKLERYAAAAHWPSTVTVEFESAPAWVTGDIADLLTRTATRPLAGNVFDRSELTACRVALLEKHGMLPGQVTVETETVLS